MPLFDPSGKPLGPASIVGAKKLVDFPPMDDNTFAMVVKQLEDALAAGVPAEVPVTVATGVLLSLVRRAQVAATPAETASPPLPEMPWMDRMPEGRELRLTPEQLEAALAEAHTSANE